MSADNFWYVTGRKVICGFASDWDDFEQRWSRLLRGQTVRVFKWRLRRTHHEHRALFYAFVGKDHEDALAWADREYAEYGVWWADR